MAMRRCLDTVQRWGLLTIITDHIVYIYMGLAAEGALHATIVLFRGEARGVGEIIRRIFLPSCGGAKHSAGRASLRQYETMGRL